MTNALQLNPEMLGACDPDARGCPACPKSVGDSLTVIDSRGRYWHTVCAGDALAEITRHDADRGSDYTYRWKWPKAKPKGMRKIEPKRSDAEFLRNIVFFEIAAAKHSNRLRRIADRVELLDRMEDD